MKKILLGICIFLFNIYMFPMLSQAEITAEEYKKWMDASSEAIKNATNESEKANAQKAYNIYEQNYNKAKRKEDCASGDCIDQESFMIDTSIFSAGGTGLKKEDSQATINFALGTLIQKLMIALWIVSLLIMTIGAGYMILYHGEDEYLSKWKSIFTAGIISLLVALSSYYIVNLVVYILYK